MLKFKLIMRRATYVTSTLAILSLAACKKEQQQAPAPAAVKKSEVKELDPKETTQRIEDFYKNMQNVRDHKGDPSVIYSVDDAVFLVEGAYNYRAVSADPESSIQYVDFNIDIPLSGGNLLAQGVSDAMWKIKQRLMDVYEPIAYENKALTFFDLEGSIVGTKVVFSVHAGISKAALDYFGAGPRSFTAAPNHGWFNSSMDQCDIDIPNRSLINSTYNGSLPGSTTVLAEYGNSNYFRIQPPISALQPGYLVNIKSAEATPADVPGAQTDYSVYDGYGHNNDIWNAYVFYPYPGASYPVDPYEVFKEFITTPMMNFYLDHIPDVINRTVPPNHMYAGTLKIKSIERPGTGNLVPQPDPTLPGYNPWTSYPAAKVWEHVYSVSYGEYVICPLTVNKALIPF